MIHADQGSGLPWAVATWHCTPNGIMCRAGHLFRIKDTQFHADYTAIEGPVFLDCTKCHPPTYFVALFVCRPHPIATCYALSEESYRSWVNAPLMLGTAEMLHILHDPEGRSLNPRWRQPR